MASGVLATMVTTTTYGTWLPGDMRGYVEHGRILPPNPRLIEHARTRLVQNPVILSDPQQTLVARALLDATLRYGYDMLDLAVGGWHVHWVARHGEQPVPEMVGRLKNQARKALNTGRIWTTGYWARYLFSIDEIETASAYIARHLGCRMTHGQLVAPLD